MKQNRKQDYGGERGKDSDAGCAAEYCSSCGHPALPGKLLCEECAALGIVTEQSAAADMKRKRGSS
jgi:uncharacterized OB-fold protein